LASGGRPLSSVERAYFEPLFKRDLSLVRIHDGPGAATATKSVGARAFTIGNDIAFAADAYRPGGAESNRLLAHELAHTLQQSQSTQPMVHRQVQEIGQSEVPEIGATNDAAEREAEAAASMLTLGLPVRINVRADERVIQRTPEGDEPTGDDVGEALALTNPRFLGDRVLESILTGQIPTLSSSHNGRRGPVAKVQQALVDLGFELPMHQMDGFYGAETEEAIRQFRLRHGPSEGDQLDGAALAVLDRIAPAPGEQYAHTVDYERLLADRRIDVTVAIGASDTTVARGSRTNYEETRRPVEDLAAERFRTWMSNNGFSLELLGWSGNEYWKATRTIDWLGSDGRPHSRSVDVWINLVVPTAGAAREFREGLRSDEITIYAGHARYGSGPDFDAMASPLENFRIGIDAAMRAAGRSTSVDEARRHGVALDEEHDLLEMVNSGSFDPNRYRVLFFNACTSLAYLDEIREHVGGPENVDVLATRRPSSFSRLESEVEVTEVQRFLEGILNAESVESVITALNEIQQRRLAHYEEPLPAGGIFSSSGIGGNPLAP
jgi:hypothetical protein